MGVSWTLNKLIWYSVDEERYRSFMGWSEFQEIKIVYIIFNIVLETVDETFTESGLMTIS